QNDFAAVVGNVVGQSQILGYLPAGYRQREKQDDITQGAFGREPAHDGRSIRSPHTHVKYLLRHVAANVRSSYSGKVEGSCSSPDEPEAARSPASQLLWPRPWHLNAGADRWSA